MDSSASVDSICAGVGSTVSKEMDAGLGTPYEHEALSRCINSRDPSILSGVIMCL